MGGARERRPGNQQVPRGETISLHYYGDSVVNSMSDIMFCMMGFALAYLLPTRIAIILVIVLEVVLALWIRDGFILNVIMLIHPFSSHPHLAGQSLTGFDRPW